MTKLSRTRCAWRDVSDYGLQLRIMYIRPQWCDYTLRSARNSAVPDTVAEKAAIIAGVEDLGRRIRHLIIQAIKQPYLYSCIVTTTKAWPKDFISSHRWTFWDSSDYLESDSIPEIWFHYNFIMLLFRSNAAKSRQNIFVGFFSRFLNFLYTDVPVCREARHNTFSRKSRY